MNCVWFLHALNSDFIHPFGWVTIYSFLLLVYFLPERSAKCTEISHRKTFFNKTLFRCPGTSKCKDPFKFHFIIKNKTKKTNNDSVFPIGKEKKFQQETGEWSIASRLREKHAWNTLEKEKNMKQLRRAPRQQVQSVSMLIRSLRPLRFIEICQTRRMRSWMIFF